MKFNLTLTFNPPEHYVELAKAADELGWDTVINRRGTTWRKLDPEVRENMDTDSAAEQALANPSLIKRPILQTEKHLRAGFNADEWKALIQGE